MFVYLSFFKLMIEIVDDYPISEYLPSGLVDIVEEFYYGLFYSMG